MSNSREAGLETHHSLKFTDEETIEYLSCLITVSYIFESFGCVLSAYVQENFLSTAARKILVMAYQIWDGSARSQKALVEI